MALTRRDWLLAGLAVPAALLEPGALGGPGPDPALDPDEAIRRSQLRVVLQAGRWRALFQATVLGRSDRRLTVLTAAHCVAEAPEGRPQVRISQGGTAWSGLLVSVARNPAHDPTRKQDIPGADNAIAVIEVAPPGGEAARALRDVRPAELTDRPAARAGGQTLWIEVFDRAGGRHVVRAGNYHNPRWLEWGGRFVPVSGDSGSGVFVLRPGAEGRPRPVLVGSVTDSDARGGGASLVCKEDPWVAQALRALAGGI